MMFVSIHVARNITVAQRDRIDKTYRLVVDLKIDQLESSSS